MPKQNDNTLLLLAAAGVAAFLLMPKKSKADPVNDFNYTPELDDTAEQSNDIYAPRGVSRRMLPNAPEVVNIDPGRETGSSIYDKIDAAKNVLETMSNAEVNIKTPKGTLRIFKGKKKKRKSNNSTTATVSADGIPDILNSVADGFAEGSEQSDNPRAKKSGRMKVIKAANRHARNVKKPKKRPMDPRKQKRPKRKIKAIKMYKTPTF